MRIHSDTLSATHIINAANAVEGVHVLSITKHGSRTKKHRFDVALNGHGIDGGRFGALDGKAATWDDWGMVLSRLYLADPDLATDAYPTMNDFVRATQGRFLDASDDGLTVDRIDPDPVHHYHRWWLVGTTATGYNLWSCKGSKDIPCTARRMKQGWFR